MNDARLQELQRRYRESNDLEDEAAWIAAALRAGYLRRPRVQFAAYLGSPAAALITPVEERLEGLFAENWSPSTSAQWRAPRYLQRVLRHVGKVAAARVCSSAVGWLRTWLIEHEAKDLLGRLDLGLLPLQRCCAGQLGYPRLEVQRGVRDELLQPDYREPHPYPNVRWFCGFMVKVGLDCVRGDGLGFKSAPGLGLWIMRRFMNEVLEENDPQARRLLAKVREDVLPWALLAGRERNRSPRISCRRSPGRSEPEDPSE